MTYSFFNLLNRFIPAKEVFAHCDIPCGIYTPEPAQTAALTVVRMMEKLSEAHIPEDEKSEDIDYTKHHNDVVRMIIVKEQHAQICKEQLLILWTDYFKEEHVAMFPSLHETFWKATKLCSKAKQEVSMETAEALKTAVDEIAGIFKKAEAAKKT